MSRQPQLPYYSNFLIIKISEIKKSELIDKYWHLKGTLSGLRHFLATEGPLKMMKNAFYLILKNLFPLKIFKFLPWFCGHVEKLLDYKDKVNFKIYDVTGWLTNKCNIHIA